MKVSRVKVSRIKVVDRLAEWSTCVSYQWRIMANFVKLLIDLSQNYDTITNCDISATKQLRFLCIRVDLEVVQKIFEKESFLPTYLEVFYLPLPTYLFFLPRSFLPTYLVLSFLQTFPHIFIP